MICDLPVYVNIDGEEFEIEQKCDYRVVLDCLEVYEDLELSLSEKHKIALCIFYKDYRKINNFNEALKKMFIIIDCKNEEETEYKIENADNKPRIMSWKKDFKFIAPAISKVLGYDIRTPGKYTHWWTFLGAFFEIEECTWSRIITIRRKLLYGKKLEDYEREFYNDNKKDIDLPMILSKDDSDWLELGY